MISCSCARSPTVLTSVGAISRKKSTDPAAMRLCSSSPWVSALVTMALRLMGPISASASFTAGPSTSSNQCRRGMTTGSAEPKHSARMSLSLKAM